MYTSRDEARTKTVLRPLPVPVSLTVLFGLRIWVKCKLIRAMADNNRCRTRVFVQRTRREFSEVLAQVIDRTQRKAGGSMGMGGKILRAGRELSAAMARGGGAGFFMVELFELHTESILLCLKSTHSLHSAV